MNGIAGTIAPHIFVIGLFLTIGWGWYLVFTIQNYRQIRHGTDRRSTDRVVALRKMVVALCVFALPAGFLLRTFLVLIGAESAFAGQVLFFALVGTNIPGVIFVLVSLRYD